MLQYFACHRIAEEAETFLRNNPGRVITIYQISKLFGKAYLRAASPLTAIHVFEKTGLYPVNRHVFTEDMFAAADPTDIPTQQTSLAQVVQDEPVLPTLSNLTPDPFSFDAVCQRSSSQTPPVCRTPPPSTSHSGSQSLSLQFHSSCHMESQ